MDNKHNQHESGFAMIGVLIIFTIITVLGLSIVTLSFASVKTSTSERDYQSAYYIAEAGLTYTEVEIEREIQEKYGHDDVREEEQFVDQLKTLATENPIYIEFHDDEIILVNEISEAERFAEINITFEEEIKRFEGIEEPVYKFIIESSGKIGEEERTVNNSMLVKWEEKYTESENEPYILPPLTVFTIEKITLSNGLIIGSIGTQSTDKHVVTVGDGDENKVGNGSIYVPVIDSSNDNRTCKTQPENEYKSYSVTRPQWSDIAPCPTEVDEMWEIPDLPEFPDFSEVDTANYSNISLGGDEKVEVDLTKNNIDIEKITLESETNLTFDIGNANRIIVIDHLNINNGHIMIKGSGKLTFYIKNEITMGSGSTINKSGEISNLDIFYKGMEPITLGGDQKIYGSLYAENSNVKLTGSGGIFGNIFSGGEEIVITGGADIKAQLILAPKAMVKTNGGGSIYGTIMSHSFTHNSGEKVIGGDDPFVSVGPISPAALRMDNGSSGGSSEGRTILEPTGKKPLITTTSPREK